MHPPEPTPQAPPTEQTSPAAPPCIAFLLQIVRSILGYGRRLDEILPAKASHPNFPTLAAGFGTHDIRRILAHIQRGILRAMMLERYLLARAAQGRDVAPVQPPAPADPAAIEALEMLRRIPTRRATEPGSRSRTDPDDPMHFEIPTLRELAAQVRARPVGQTIAEICLDLGIGGIHCDAEMWDDISQALLHFGANLKKFYAVTNNRRIAFVKERDKRPETWDRDWRDRPKDAIRQLLGHLLGDPRDHNNAYT